MEDKLRSLHIDYPLFRGEIKVDDFLVAVGKKQSNSVYHIAEVKDPIPKMRGRVNRYYIKVLKTDLLTALQRDESQQLIPIQWYPRTKKKKI